MTERVIYYDFEDFARNGTKTIERRVVAPDGEPQLKSLKFLAERAEGSGDTRKKTLFYPYRVNNVVNYGQYSIHVFGIDVYGNKSKVVIRNVDIFFDVRLPHGMTVETASAIIRSKTVDFQPLRIENYEAKPVERYYINKCVFLRVYMNTISELSKAVKKIQTELPGMPTYNDDVQANSYDRRTFVMNQISPSMWWVLNDIEPLDKVGYYLVNNIKNIEMFPGDQLAYPELAVPNSVYLGWDIETSSTRGMGEVPKPEFEEDDMRVISYAVSRGYSKEPEMYLAAFTFRHMRADMAKKRLAEKIEGDARIVLINCKNERDLLRAHGLIHKFVNPDFITDFNGGNYDNPWIIERANRYSFLVPLVSMMQQETFGKLTDDGILYQYNNVPEMKISAEEPMFKMKYYPLSSAIQIDMMPVMKRSFKNEDVVRGQAMNHYLRLCGLPPKADMPHTAMRSFFMQDAGQTPIEDKEVLEIGLIDVLYYALIDSISPTRLLHARNIVGDYSQLSNLVYLNFLDTLYRADSMKVTQFITYFAQNMGYVMTKRPIFEKPIQGKYQGGHVEIPRRGLYKYIPKKGEYHPGDEPGSNEVEIQQNPHVPYYEATPTAALDFSSLYPSLMRELNICPTQYIDNGMMAKACEDAGIKVYRHQIDANNICWTVNHDGDPKKFGIIQNVLANLVDERNKVKKLLKPIKAEIEVIKSKYSGMTSEEKEAADHRLETLEFQEGYYDAKQKALKVIANTTYGVLGSTKSSFSNVDLATVVTLMGRTALLSVIDFHRTNDSTVIYGDTDSTYFLFSIKKYADIYEKRLTMTRTEYNYALVERAFKLIKVYADEVNNYLLTLFPHGYLKMAYEELVFPVVFRDRKKYAGIAHENNIKFDIRGAKDIFSRGFEFKQKGRNQLIVDSQVAMLSEFLNINNNKTEIVAMREHMNYIFNEYKWNYDDVAEFKKYNPEKQNISVIKFYKKMLRKDPNNVPLPNDKFKTVVVRHNMYNTRGMTNKISVGECMEYLDRAKEHNMELDIQYYVEKKLSGIYTGLIFYLPQIDKEGLLLQRDLTDEQVEKNKSLVLSAAKKYLRNIIKEEYKSEENYNHLVAKRFYKHLQSKHPQLEQLTCNYALGMKTVEEIRQGSGEPLTPDVAQLDAEAQSRKDAVPSSSSVSKKMTRAEYRVFIKKLLMEHDNIMIDIERVLNGTRDEYERIDDIIKDIRVQCEGKVEKYTGGLSLQLEDFPNIVEFNHLVDRLNDIMTRVKDSQNNIDF